MVSDSDDIHILTGQLAEKSDRKLLSTETLKSSTNRFELTLVEQPSQHQRLHSLWYAHKTSPQIDCILSCKTISSKHKR